MVKPQRYTAPYWNKTLKALGVTLLLLVFLLPASVAQNTKGDKPQSGSGAKRENRFRTPQKKKVKGKKSYNRAQGKRSSRANRAQSSQPAKVYSQKGPFVNKSSRTVKDQKSNLKSATSQSRVSAKSSASQTRKVYPQKGPFVNNPSRVPQSKPRVTSNKSTIKRITSQNKSISSRNVYRQRGPYVNNPSKVPNDKPRLTKNYSPGYRRVKTPPKDPQQKWRANTTPHYGVRSVSGQTKNVFSQKGPFIHNPSQKAQQSKRTISNQSQVAKVSSGSRVSGPGKGKKRKGAMSASRPYISRKSINAFAGFWNKKPTGEKAYTSGDLAGHKLRKKNFQTKMPVIVNPTANPYKPKISVGDQPYQGPAKGGYKSATRSGKAWSGDIAGRKIRGKNYSSKKTVGPGQPVFPPKKAKQKVGDTPYKGPGGGYNTFRVDKRTTGPLPRKSPGASANKIDFYQGSVKGFRPLKGGGSVSGKTWNNRNTPIVGKTPAGKALQIGSFRGNLRAQRPAKGGGSISGRMWNNREQPLQGKTPGIGADGVGSFQGNLKATRKTPSKEVGGIPRNFKDTKPVLRDQGEEYTGHIKAHKPLKGGGSISGRLWNNKEQPLQGKAPQGQFGIDTYQGSIRASRKEQSKEVGGLSPKKYRDLTPAMRDQGEEFTGFIKLKRLPRPYIKGPNSAQTALKKARPDKGTYKANGLQVRVKQQDYKTKPYAAEGSLKGIAASKSSIKASEYSKVLRLKNDYIHNPSSAKEALKTREPGKAFARASDYQGNIKMKKFDLFGKKDLHPDAQFVKTNKNNVDSERSLLTNFKLAWAKLFGKSDLQPDSVKEKERKPRYQKDEGQIWYNKHNSSPGGSNSLKNVKTQD